MEAGHLRLVLTDDLGRDVPAAGPQVRYSRVMVFLKVRLLVNGKQKFD